MRILMMAVVVFLASCESGSHLMTTFESKQSIEKGTQVYFQSQKIGLVDRVEQDKEKFIVHFTVNHDALDKISKSAVVVVNRFKSGQPLEIFNPVAQEHVDRVQSGASLQGMASMLELGSWTLSGVIGSGGDVFSVVNDSLKEYLASEQFDKDKQAMSEAINQNTQQLTEKIRHIQNELSSAVEDLQTSESEMANTIDELAKELAPLALELGAGGQVLMMEIQNLIEQMNNAQASGAGERDEEQQENEQRVLGEQVLSSLLGAVELWSEKLEQGSN